MPKLHDGTKFLSLGTWFDNYSHPPSEGPQTSPCVSFNELFSDEDLCRTLKDLNGKAAVGPQGITSHVIKEVFADCRSRPGLLALMNRCWAEGRIPRAWSESEIFVLYKGKGNESDPSNYQG